MEDAVQYVYDYLEDNIPDYEWEFPEEGFLHLNLGLLMIFLSAYNFALIINHQLIFMI